MSICMYMYVYRDTTTTTSTSGGINFKHLYFNYYRGIGKEFMHIFYTHKSCSMIHNLNFKKLMNKKWK